MPTQKLTQVTVDRLKGNTYRFTVAPQSVEYVYDMYAALHSALAGTVDPRVSFDGKYIDIDSISQDEAQHFADSINKSRPGVYRIKAYNGARTKTSAYVNNTLMVCSDCLLFIANGDLPEDDEMEKDIIAGVESFSGHLHAGDSDEDEEFSRHSCDCCGTNLAGSRHQVIELMDGDDPNAEDEPAEASVKTSSDDFINQDDFVNLMLSYLDDDLPKIAAGNFKLVKPTEASVKKTASDNQDEFINLMFGTKDYLGEARSKIDASNFKLVMQVSRALKARLGNTMDESFMTGLRLLRNGLKTGQVDQFAKGLNAIGKKG